MNAKEKKNNAVFDSVKTAFIKKHDCGNYRFEKDLTKLIDLREKQMFERAKNIVAMTGMSPLSFANVIRVLTENWKTKQTNVRCAKCDDELLVVVECPSCEIQTDDVHLK